VSPLLTLAGDEALRHRLGHAGKDRCRQPFDHEYMTRRIREVYERVLKSRGE
jgi:hypothetical protein